VRKSSVLNPDPEFQRLLRNSVYVPFITLATLLGILIWLIGVYSQRMEEVNLTLKSIADASQTQSLILDTESSFEGYAYSNDEAFLDPYVLSTKKLIPEVFGRLQANAQVDADQVEQVEIDFLHWLRELSPYTSQKPVQREEFLAALKDKKPEIEHVRKEMSNLITLWETNLRQREEDQSRTVTSSLLLIIGIAFAFGAFLGVSGYRSLQTLSLRYTHALDLVEEQKTELALINDNLELTVEERTAELKSANRELEQFSYTAAHDLRAPLRWIITSIEIFRDDYASLLPADAIDELDRSSDAAKRLSLLIDKLLEQARIGRVELQSTHINMSAMAQDISKELAAKGWDQPVECKIQSRMTADGDAVLIRLLLQNLMDNAYKYSSKTVNPKVEVKCSKENVFCVSDNGVGFSMEQEKKIYEPFERLHSKADFPGDGMGLANAARIVQRHGGRLWCESQPGKGSKFYFTLLNGRPLDADLSESKNP
jgi:signal transduction histidine kinase